MKHTFVEVDHAKLHIVETLDFNPDEIAEGSYVKLEPRLKESERATFDANEAAARLYDAGASVVIVVPRYIPETFNKLEVEVVEYSSTEILKQWFAEQPMDEDLLDDAYCLAIGFTSEEGL